ncbi:MAG: hypothetical protein HUJ53_02420 [Holdemanella sp.]|nr:hypothetical protein [Holdemanella sp.]
MSIIETNSQNTPTFPSLYVILYLNSLKTNRSLYYHDCLIEWSMLFNRIHLPVYIVSNDDPSILKDIKKRYNSDFIYCSNPANDIFIKKNLYKDKVIYGKKYRTIYTQIELVHNDKIIYTSKRINKNTITSLYLMAVDIKYALFLTKLQKDIDTLGKLC